MVMLANTFAQVFTEHVAKHGPSFVYGHLSAPYDGCFWKNCVVFVEGDYAYLMADLKGTRQAHYKTEAPAARKGNKYFRAGCIKVADLENVLSEPKYNSGLEIHPIAELGENTPYALYGHAVAMAQELGYDVTGQFKCKICGYDFADGGEPMYLQGDFKGNGGIGIEVGAPVCEECYNARACSYCSEEVEPYQNDIDDEGHCIYCSPEITCTVSGQKLKLDWQSTKEEIEAYKQGLSVEGLAALNLAKDYDDKASGNLF
jgi:hypothetical protein